MISGVGQSIMDVLEEINKDGERVQTQVTTIHLKQITEVSVSCHVTTIHLKQITEVSVSYHVR